MDLITAYSYMNYKIINSKGLLVLDYSDSISGYQKQNIWSKCKLRKPMKCYLSGEMMPAGTEVYRPITTGYNRGHRFKASLLETYLK